MRAGNEARTRDPQLGIRQLADYQQIYSIVSEADYMI